MNFKQREPEISAHKKLFYNFCASEMLCIQRNVMAFLEQEIPKEFLCFSGFSAE